jgi:hypothetical protein
MLKNIRSIEEKIAYLEKEFPLVLHTRSSRQYTGVRRMKAEKELAVPIKLRTGQVISVKIGKRANEMSEREWDEFYQMLSDDLKRDYPDLYQRVFADRQIKIPKSLRQCPQCGEYKGQITDDGEDIIISCICAGVLCPKCGTHKIHRPISNSYDPANAEVVHYSSHSAMAGCEKCRGKNK